MEQTAVVPEVKPEPTLVERVANFKPEAPKPAEVTPPAAEGMLTPKEIAEIKDPTVRMKAEAFYKSIQSDYTKKTQALSEERKKVEEDKKAFEASRSQANQRKVWTVEAIQKELLTDPTFVAEAQRIAQANPAPANPNSSGLTDDQWSALTSEEKAKFQLMEQKLSKLEQQSKLSEQQAQQALVQQQHQALKAKYGDDYASDIVDTTVRDIVDGRAQIGLEHIFKALNYEKAMNKAYELGRLDALGKTKDKIGSMSYEGGQVSGAKNTIEPEKNESTQNYFRRLAINRQAEMKSR